MVHYFDEARVQQLLSVPELLQGVREALVALTLGQSRGAFASNWAMRLPKTA